MLSILSAIKAMPTALIVLICGLFGAMTAAAGIWITVLQLEVRSKEKAIAVQQAEIKKLQTVIKDKDTALAVLQSDLLILRKIVERNNNLLREIQQEEAGKRATLLKTIAGLKAQAAETDKKIAAIMAEPRNASEFGDALEQLGKFLQERGND